MGDFTDRRTVLRSSAAACAAGLAGCLGVLDDPEDSDGNESDVADGDDFDGNGTDPGGGEDPEPTLEEWPMFQYDAGNTGYAEGSGPTGDVEVDWTYEATEKFRGAPAIKDGTVYVGCDDEQLYAFDLEDGTEIWSSETRSQVRKPVLVMQDKVLVSMGNGVDAYDRADGDVAWEFDTAPGQGATTPVMQDGIVVVGSGEPAVYGIEIETGHQEWRQEMPRNLSEPAAISRDTVYIGDWTSGLHVLDLEDGRERYSTTIDEVQVTGPTVDDGVIYIGGDEGTLYALDANSLGEVLWTFDANKWIEGSPVVGEDFVFFADQEGILYALDKTHGELQWSEELERRTRSAIALANDLLYIGGGWGTLSAFDVESGSTEFTIDLSRWPLLSPAVVEGTLVLADNVGSIWSVTNKSF